MSEEQGALERITSEALEWGLGSTWARLAPLSTGAVVSGAALVGGATLVQRLLGVRGRRWLAFMGGAVVVPLALLVLYSQAGDEVDEQEDDGMDDGAKGAMEGEA